MNVLRSIKKIHSTFLEPEGLRLLLVSYWRILLGLVFSLMIGVFLYGGWQLFGIMNGVFVPQNNAPASNVPQTTSVDSMQVEAVLRGFAARKTRFDMQATSSAIVADPTQ